MNISYLPFISIEKMKLYFMRKQAYKSKNAPLVTISTYCEVQTLNLIPFLDKYLNRNQMLDYFSSR